MLQMPRSRLSSRAASSNCCSMSSKMRPVVGGISLLTRETGRHIVACLAEPMKSGTFRREMDDATGALEAAAITQSMRSGTETDRQSWEQSTLGPSLQRSPERETPFATISGHPIERLYTADDLPGLDYARDIGDTGAYPYAR